MAALVYILSTLTCGVCAYIQFRQFFKMRVKLLMWIAICFAGLTLNNALLIVDILLVPLTDFSISRLIVADFSVAILAVGFVWESR